MARGPTGMGGASILPVQRHPPCCSALPPHHHRENPEGGGSDFVMFFQKRKISCSQMGEGERRRKQRGVSLEV